MQSLLPVLALYTAVRLASLLLLPRFFARAEDPLWYRQMVEAALAGAPPYDSPAIAYPPAALLLFLLPYTLAPVVGYREAFTGLMLLFDMATTLLLAAACRDRFPPPLLAAAVYLAVTIGLWPILLGHYDLAVAATLAAALLWHRRQPGGSGAWLWLGLGTALKGAPVVLLPFLALAAYRRGSWPAVCRGCAAFLAAAVLPSLPGLIWVGPESVPALMHNYSLWGLHIETLYGSALMLAGPVAAGEPRFTPVLAYELTTPVAVMLAELVAPMLQALALGITYALLIKPRPQEQPDLALPWLAALLGLILFGKSLPGQYLIWLVPLAAAAAVPSVTYGMLALLLTVAALLTTIIFPLSYQALIEGQAPAIATLAVRNLLLLLLFGLALRTLQHRQRDLDRLGHPVLEL